MDEFERGFSDGAGLTDDDKINRGWSALPAIERGRQTTMRNPKPNLLDPDILMRAIRARDEWFKRRYPDLRERYVGGASIRETVFEAYENGFCQGFSDAKKEG